MPEEHDDTAVDAARLGFRNALLRASRTHNSYDELDAAATLYCQALHDQGLSPEATVIRAKRVIDEAIDDQDHMVAERAVQTCIRSYYQNYS